MIGFTSHFILGFVMSLIGSVPPGMVNLAVAETSVKKGLSGGAYVAAGAVLVEFLQVLIALKLSTWLLQYPWLPQAIKVIAIPMLLAAGIYFWLSSSKAGKPEDAPDYISKQRLAGFGKGVLLGVFNPLAIPYWLFYGTYFGSINWLYFDDPHLFTFITGTAIGTFVLLMFYGRLGIWVFERFQQLKSVSGKIIGGVLAALAIFQLIQLIINWKSFS